MINKRIDLATNKKMCSGCYLCSQICPVNAITMRKDQKGFCYPHIDLSLCISCHKCENTCPTRNTLSDMKSDPTVYAFSRNETKLSECSSGGFFSAISEYFVSIGGFVCGAVWKKDFEVAHVISNDTNVIKSMSFSKYVQSSMECIYDDIAGVLREHKPILFAGCPCQVAAIKQFFKQYSELLFTIDLICHGVPSSLMLSDYLSEKVDVSLIEEVCFREKEGWGSCLDIYLSTGEKLHGTNSNDIYMQGFLNNITIRPACTDCRFSKLPRQGDITIGDLWAAAHMNLSIPWQKGINVVLSNSNKGDRFLENIFSSINETLFLQKLDNTKGLNTNIFRCGSQNKYENGYFDQHYNGKDFGRTVFRTMHNYDVGLVQYISNNYGSIATSWGIVNLLKDMGFSPLLLDNLFPIDGERKRIMKKVIDLSSEFMEQMDYNAANDACDTFVVGSDVSWYWCGYSLQEIERNHAMFLGFADSKKRCISIAPCMGREGVYISKEHKDLIGHYLSQMDYISVREESSVELCKNEFGLDVKHLLDPVFLCDAKRYIELANSVDCDKENYIFAYILDPTPEKREVLIRMMNDTGKKLVVVLDRGFNYDANKKKINLDDFVKPHLPFEKWVSYIYNADYVVTDSYHGACLSIILHKPFVAIKNRMGNRFDTLINLLDVPNAIVSSAKELLDTTYQIPSFDWEKVDSLVKEKKEDSLQWLINAFEGPLVEKANDGHVLSQVLHQMLLDEGRKKDKFNREYGFYSLKKNKLKEKANKMSSVLEAIWDDNDILPSERVFSLYKEISNIISVEEYFDFVRSYEMYVLIVAQDSANSYFGGFLEKAKLSCKQNPGFRESYIMLTDGKKVDYEASGKQKAIHYSTQLIPPQKQWGLNNNSDKCQTVHIKVVSMGFQNETGTNYSSIMINNVDYSCKGRGINAATIDCFGNVVDTWNIDLFGDGSMKMRRNVYG